jgi:hypothetical protein
MACVGHCVSQARHWMQSFSRAGSDLFWPPGASAQSYSDTGHTLIHTPSPTQTSQSTAA